MKRKQWEKAKCKISGAPAPSIIGVHFVIGKSMPFVELQSRMLLMSSTTDGHASGREQMQKATCFEIVKSLFKCLVPFFVAPPCHYKMQTKVTKKQQNHKKVSLHIKESGKSTNNIWLFSLEALAFCHFALWLGYLYIHRNCNCPPV